MLTTYSARRYWSLGGSPKDRPLQLLCAVFVILILIALAANVHFHNVYHRELAQHTPIPLLPETLIVAATDDAAAPSTLSPTTLSVAGSACSDAFDCGWRDDVRRYGARVDVVSFPIGVVAYNRPELLNRTLTSLLAVDGADVSAVTLYQDGNNAAVTAVAKAFGIDVVHNAAQHNAHEEAAARIARHYRFTLSALFDRHPANEYVVVVEDDMIFAKDFLSFFTQTQLIYDTDPTVYCISSWNDNGFSSLSSDARRLYRTNFFIGLGWMVKRSLYKGEWESQWPYSHWDHWLRDDQRRRGREAVYPSVSRNYNIGKIGSHSDESMFAQYFANIRLNPTRNVYLGNMSRMRAAEYEERLTAELDSSRPLTQLDELFTKSSEATADDVSAFPSAHLVVFYQCRGQFDGVWEDFVSVYFQLWHSIPMIRGMHNGVHQFKYRNNHVALVATFSPHYTRRNDTSTLKVFHSEDFAESALRGRNARTVRWTLADNGASCIVACQAYGETVGAPMRCEQFALYENNNCAALRSIGVAQCAACRIVAGGEFPAVSANGDCLTTDSRPLCRATTHAAQRFCPCVLGTFGGELTIAG